MICSWSGWHGGGLEMWLSSCPSVGRKVLGFSPSVASTRAGGRVSGAGKQATVGESESFRLLVERIILCYDAGRRDACAMLQTRALLARRRAVPGLLCGQQANTHMRLLCSATTTDDFVSSLRRADIVVVAARARSMGVSADWRRCALASPCRGPVRQARQLRPDVTHSQGHLSSTPVPVHLSRTLFLSASIPSVSSRIHHGRVETLIPAAAFAARA
jgi:hypothetical protein